MRNLNNPFTNPPPLPDPREIFSDIRKYLEILWRTHEIIKLESGIGTTEEAIEHHLLAIDELLMEDTSND